MIPPEFIDWVSNLLTPTETSVSEKRILNEKQNKPNFLKDMNGIILSIIFIVLASSIMLCLFLIKDTNLIKNINKKLTKLKITLWNAIHQTFNNTAIPMQVTSLLVLILQVWTP
jgi:hypothetical protein